MSTSPDAPNTSAPVPAAPPASTLPTDVPSPPAARKRDVHEVRFIAYPKLLFVWPIILMGLLFWPLMQWHWVDPSTLGWIYLLVVLFVILTLGVDIDRNHAVFWAVVCIAIWLLGLVLKDRAGITVFGNIYNFFRSLDVTYSQGFGLSLSIILLVPFLLMFGWARLNDRWRITHNEFEHYSFGRMDDSLGRGAKTIRTEYPDVLEALLGLAGTLIVLNATGQQELRRIPHVMFLPLVRAKLNLVLEKMAVTGAITEEEEG
jgi:hypothetical protein